MANVLHSALTSGDLHEPKGIASASANQVYVANGAGSGTWDSIFQYAGIHTLEADAVSVGSIGTTAQTFPFANDGPDNGVVADSANNRITLTEAGVYYVNFSISFSTTAAGDAGLYEFKLMNDGVATGHAMARQMSGSADTGSSGFSALITVGAGSQLTVEVESDDGGDSDDIDIYHAKLLAFKVS